MRLDSPSTQLAGAGPWVAREPASTGTVARHYLGLLARERGVSTFLLPLSVLLLGSVNRTGFSGLALLLALAFFFPLYQWRGGGRDLLDQAMPVDFARHRRVRTACGAAWAALALAVCVALYTALMVAGWHGLGGFPAWYPLALFGWGMSAYLFGAAAWVRAERPGRVLTLLYCTAGTLPEWLPKPWQRAVVGAADPAVLRAAPWPAWAAACLLTLGLACAAVWLASSVGRLPSFARALPPWLRARGRAAVSGPPALSSGVPSAPRRAASIAMILRREMTAVSHDARWALLAAVLIATQLMRPSIDLTAEMAALPLAGRSGVLLILPIFAFCWPLLVWMDDRGPGREWAEAVPAGRVLRRALRLLAGAAWLELIAGVVGAGVVTGAWRAGVIASPAEVPAGIWAVVTLGVLIMYLVGSIPLLLSPSHPVRYTVVWLLVFLFLIAQPVIMTRGWRFSPGAALSVVGMNPPRHWGEAMLIWLPLLLAGVTAAIAAGVARDRDGPERNPP